MSLQKSIHRCKYFKLKKSISFVELGTSNKLSFLKNL
jgi:hypothetical protein